MEVTVLQRQHELQGKILRGSRHAQWSWQLEYLDEAVLITNSLFFVRMLRCIALDFPQLRNSSAPLKEGIGALSSRLARRAAEWSTFNGGPLLVNVFE